METKMERVPVWDLFFAIAGENIACGVFRDLLAIRLRNSEIIVVNMGGQASARRFLSRHASCNEAIVKGSV